MCAVLSHVQLFATPWSVARQAPLSMGILQVGILEWVAIPSSRLNPWVGKIPWRRAWQPTPLVLPGWLSTYMCILTYIYVKVLVTQSCATLGDPIDCSLTGRLLCPRNSPGIHTHMHVMYNIHILIFIYEYFIQDF